MDDSPHPLKVWIDANGGQAAFAKRVGCSEAYLSEVLSDKKEPSLGKAEQWSEATNGEVPISAFAGRVASRRARADAAGAPA